jgi:hypothetical protein
MARAPVRRSARSTPACKLLKAWLAARCHADTGVGETNSDPTATIDDFLTPNATWPCLVNLQALLKRLVAAAWDPPHGAEVVAAFDDEGSGSARQAVAQCRRPRR